MVLDGITVLFDTALLSVIVGALLIFAGTRQNGDRSLPIWGAGYLCASAGVFLFALRSHIPDIWSVDLGGSGLILAYGLFFAGVRRFAGHRTPLWVIFAGSAIWLSACRIEAFYNSGQARIILFSGIDLAYLVVTCVALARIREALPSKAPLVFVLGLHSVAYFTRALSAFFIPSPSGTHIVITPWFIVLAVESFFHLVASSLLLVTMSKERSENRVQRLASIDSLTGLHNRRSFLEQASLKLKGSAQRMRPACLLMIDIDHFKAINDEAGHQAGDKVLQEVAILLERGVRPMDLCGRLGGEEFVCFLADCDRSQGRDVAERLRLTIQRELAGLTVSVGVACTEDISAEVDLEHMLLAADHALYASKKEGRNRVTLARVA
ncbi:GGDEF domain-containing protein [Methylovirgula sp. 4M-Z18]|uniref:GGDEF domain-containing protein n=1 Tax=Methylovirgula sp. 4M-Z18 TaxID=2293567 RepID=UPI000E2EF285|nr:GGDEF domain-containing protein [Methylovirgula sp. 4M-Z18]RFB78029.1 GGDEF domain-containing protein [Methylovirgula sp. 4M-Z18]